jgi:predicted metal-dependent phosphoesterase TrpH
LTERADLHTHTTFSDGLLSPDDLMEKVSAAGLTSVAVTDHDTVEGLVPARAAAEKRNINFIPGIEISAVETSREVHILGYFFDQENSTLKDYSTAVFATRLDRVGRIVERLSELGIGLDYDSIVESSGPGTIGRPHVAQAMVDSNHVSNTREAFKRYLRNGGPAFVASKKIDAVEAIAMIAQAGGIAVLAHPGHWVADSTIMKLIRHGLHGIEVVHPSHDASLVRYYRELAQEFVLLQTGGSDYHGPRTDQDETIGRYYVGQKELDRLQTARQRGAGGTS